MSGAIGPGSWVERIVPSPTGLFTVGAIYRVRDLIPASGGGCTCGERHAFSLSINGKPDRPLPGKRGWCPNCFRPWPPEPTAELRCEPVDQDEPVPA